MRIELLILMIFVILLTPSSAFASWHWSSPYEVCGTEVIKKGERCELQDNEKSKNNTKNQSDESIDNERKIPEWIRNNAKWWSEDTIDDNSFVSGIQYLMKKKIINIPETQQDSGLSSDEIPLWVKNSSEWWADGQIDDESFISAIQFLIKEGIIGV